MPAAERWSWVALGAIVVVALAWRALGALAIVYPSVDGVNYMTIARTLVRDGSLMFSTFPPGWPSIISLPLFLVGADEPMVLLRTAQAANVVLGTVAVVLAYLAARRPLGRIGALLLAAFVAFLPDLVITATTDLSEPSYLAVLLAGWWALRTRRDWATGLLFGFAYLIRPEALIVLLGVVALRSARDHRLHWKPLVGAAVFVVPFVLFVHRATGVWALSSKGVFLDRAVEDRGPVELLTGWFTNAGAFLGELPPIVGWPVVVLAVWGAVRWRGPELLALLPVLIVPLFSFRMDPRFWMPLVPFVAWLAVAGGRDLVGRIGAARPRGLAAAVLVVVAVVGTAIAARPDFFRVGLNLEAYSGMRAAGAWLAENSDPDAVVVGYKPYVAFWSGRDFHRLPERDDAESTVDRIRELGHEYLVVNRAVVRALTPQLAPLISSDPLEPSLARKVVLVHVSNVDDDPRQITAIYRIVPVGGL
jgi:hypothetical protein